MHWREYWVEWLLAGWLVGAGNFSQTVQNGWFVSLFVHVSATEWAVWYKFRLMFGERKRERDRKDHTNNEKISRENEKIEEKGKKNQQIRSLIEWTTMYVHAECT